MVLQKSYSYTDDYPQVLARGEGLRSPRSFLIDRTKVASWAGVEGRIQRLVAPGIFMGATSDPGKVRPLPRTLLAAALVASTTTTFAVSPKTARHFVAGDILTALAPFAVITVTGTWAAADTAQVTIGGRATTATAADAVNANIAILIAAAINADPILNKMVKAIAAGATVIIYALDMRSTYPISTAETAAGSLPITGSLTALAAGASVGAVVSVDPLTETITLAAASATSLPVGVPIGVATCSPADANGEGYGMLSPKNPVDLEWGTDDIYGLFIGATVYKDRLPYWDGELAALFPIINLV
jgi:hypothetical protein